MAKQIRKVKKRKAAKNKFLSDNFDFEKLLNFYHVSADKTKIATTGCLAIVDIISIANPALVLLNTFAYKDLNYKWSVWRVETVIAFKPITKYSDAPLERLLSLKRTIFAKENDYVCGLLYPCKVNPTLADKITKVWMTEEKLQQIIDHKGFQV